MKRIGRLIVSIFFVFVLFTFVSCKEPASSNTEIIPKPDTGIVPDEENQTPSLENKEMGFNVVLPGKNISRAVYYTKDDASYYTVVLKKEETVICSKNGNPGETLKFTVTEEGDYNFSVSAYDNKDSLIAEGVASKKITFADGYVLVKVTLNPKLKELDVNIDIEIDWNEGDINYGSEGITLNRAFSKGDIAGDMTGWDSGTWLSANDDKYEYVYEFTALKDMDYDGDGILKFKVRSTAGVWDTGDFGDATLTTDGKEVELKLASFGGPEAKMPFEAYHIYLITVTSKDGKVYAKVEDKGLDIIPVPFILSGMFVHGGMYDASWGAVLDGALLEFETTTKDGVAVYKKDFTASSDDENFKIASADWNNGWAGTEFTLDAADYVEFKEKRVDGVAYDTATDEKLLLTEGAYAGEPRDTNNAVLKGTKAGKTYRLYIKTTPDEKVYAKVVTLNAVVIDGATVKATGLPADLNGKDLYFTGSFNNWVKPGDEGSIKATVANGEISVTLPKFEKDCEGAEKAEFAVEGKFTSAGWTKPEIFAADGNIKFTLTPEKYTLKGTYKSDDDEVYVCDWIVE